MKTFLLLFCPSIFLLQSQGKTCGLARAKPIWRESVFSSPRLCCISASPASFLTWQSWLALDVLQAEENHRFASSKEQKCCNPDSSSNEERVNKCTCWASSPRASGLGEPRLRSRDTPRLGWASRPPAPFHLGLTRSSPSFWILPAVPETALHTMDLHVLLQEVLTDWDGRLCSPAKVSTHRGLNREPRGDGAWRGRRRGRGFEPRAGRRARAAPENARNPAEPPGGSLAENRGSDSREVPSQRN